MKKLTNGDTCPLRNSLGEPPPEIAATIAVLGGKWTIPILWQLMQRPCRFNELQRAVLGITQHVLTVRLRELQAQGALTRTVFAEMPPRVEYRLTDHGLMLSHVLKSMAEWSGSHLNEVADKIQLNSV